ncbi:MAG: hypothetical protein IKK51_08790, partial [Oscillospiraceae bacterium]|nr:hypothetical protein [Oscillospiraceae bacterium]
KNTSAENGSTIKVSAKANGHGLKYTWYMCHPGEDKFVQASATGANYYFTMSEERDGRQMYCVITDMFNNSVQTDTVTLTMSK